MIKNSENKMVIVYTHRDHIPAKYTAIPAGPHSECQTPKMALIEKWVHMTKYNYRSPSGNQTLIVLEVTVKTQDNAVSR